MIASNAGLSELQSLATSKDPGSARRVAQEFEALIVGEMLKFASKPLAGGHALDGGSAGRMAMEQFQAELAQIVSRGRGLGLARDLERELDSGDGASAPLEEQK